jgi:redox-sensing transcriptional repressor
VTPFTNKASVRRISDSAVRRLSAYLRFLRELSRQGRDVVSSPQLAEGTGTTAAQVRKDLSAFGSFGTRGRGYPVDALRGRLQEILGLGRRWRVAVVGVGKIGGALLGYGDLARRGFDVVAAFDADPRKIGSERFGVVVCSMEDLEGVLRERDVEIAILAVPPEAAREVAERLAAAGVGGILSFAGAGLCIDDRAVVRAVDVTLELEGLTYALSGAGAERGESESE